MPSFIILVDIRLQDNNNDIHDITFLLNSRVIIEKQTKNKNQAHHNATTAKSRVTQKTTVIMRLDVLNVVRTTKQLSAPRTEIVPLNTLLAPNTTLQTLKDAQRSCQVSTHTKISFKDSTCLNLRFFSFNPESNHSQKLINSQNTNSDQISYLFRFHINSKLINKSINYPSFFSLNRTNRLTYYQVY